MPSPIPGVHHVTAIASDPAENLRFYTQTLGLRLVKRSINQDDVSVYHLFYADHRGSPGTSMTFFPYVGAQQGRVGTGQVYTTQFLIPEGAVEWWADRLAELTDQEPDVDERFDESVIPLLDPDGLQIELVGIVDAPTGDPPDGLVPAEHAIRGFRGVTLGVQSPGRYPALLERFGYDRAGSEGGRTRYVSHGELGDIVDILEMEQGPRGIPGAGTVHHVAFYVADEEQEAWREILVEEGLRPTGVIDRKWFKSVYARTPGGILFEFATPSPGYDVDEDVEELGEKLMLPSWLEDRRAEIEAGLPDLPDPGF